MANVGTVSVEFVDGTEEKLEGLRKTAKAARIELLALSVAVKCAMNSLRSLSEMIKEIETGEQSWQE